MLKKGMIFEGLRVHNEVSRAADEEMQKLAESVVIREEGFYGTDADRKKSRKEELRESMDASILRQAYESLIQEEGEEICLDVTYFLVFAISQNPVCQKDLGSMNPKDVLHYQKLFLEGNYHGEYFLSCLGYEEYCFAQILLGMLEEARECEGEAAERAYERFLSLVKHGWREARKELLAEKQVSYDRILDWARPYAEQPAMGMSQICVIYLLAEQFQVEIRQTLDYYLMLECMVEKNTTWNSREEEVMEGAVWGRGGNGKGLFGRKLEEQLAAPLQAAVGFRKEEYEDFDYYLQNLYHLGGIDRNVLYGERLDEKSQQLLIELGDFEETLNMEEYVYSLNIVLLCSYLKKCLEKLKEDHPACWYQKLDEAQESRETMKTELNQLKENFQAARKKCRELEEKLEKTERAVRRSESRLQKAEKQHQEERQELIRLREQIYCKGQAG